MPARETPDTPPLGRALRHWRLRRGIKQAHLAALVEVAQATVSRWEAGRQRPTATQAATIARLLQAAPHAEADAHLRRLVESSTLPVHLICDATHRLFAASAVRWAEWGRRRDELLGVPLLRFAPDDIAAVEAALPATGWFDAPSACHHLSTGGRAGGLYRVVPGRLLWERLQLSDGGFVRLVTSLPG